MRMRYSVLIIIAVLLGMTMTSGRGWAAETAYDGFDYGTAGLDGQSGGTGFSGSWSAAGMETEATSLAAPNGYGLATSGGKVAADNNGLSAERTLGAGIDLDPAQTQVMYVSFLMATTSGTAGDGYACEVGLGDKRRARKE